MFGRSKASGPSGMSSCSLAHHSSNRRLAALRYVFAATRTLLILAALLSASPAAAEVKYFPKTDSTLATILVTGDITTDDIEAFAKALDAIQAKDEAYVRLDSTGGYALAGIAIGDLVRNSGMKTWVDDNVICSSACGAIWIAGSRKWAGANSHIGFHGAYSPQSGLASPSRIRYKDDYLAAFGPSIGHALANTRISYQIRHRFRI